MADNYQFDRNSKLFQKFMMEKSRGKNSSPSLQDNLPKAFNEKIQKQQAKIDKFQTINTNSSQIQQRQPIISYQRGILNVQIDDEQQEQNAKNGNHHEFNDLREQSVIKFQEKKEQIVHERLKSVEKPSQIVQTKRQRRPRQFGGNAKIQSRQIDLAKSAKADKLESRERERFDSEERSYLQQRSIVTRHDQYVSQQRSNSKKYPPPPKAQQNQSDTDYKRKYEKLYAKFEQMKQNTQKQNKERKKQLTNWQQQLQLIKQKLYEVQSREDTLIIQNQRLKDKCQGQSMMKMKLEEDNKELNFKIQQMEDMLEGKETAIKKKSDELQYFKHQTEVLREEISTLQMEHDQLQARLQLLEGETSMLRKQRQNKESLLQEFKRNIPALVHQNNAAKDQLYALTVKLYQTQTQNQILKADLKRAGGTSTNTQMHYRKEIPITKEHEPVHNYSQLQVNHQQPVSQQPRRRGEFARQRITTSTHVYPNSNIPSKEETHAPSKQQTNPLANSRNKAGSFTSPLARRKLLEEQLEKLMDMKAMNGPMRRRKIEIQREIMKIDQENK